MPFHVVQFALAGAFIAVWAFIALTVLRDRLRESRDQRLAACRPGAHERRRGTPRGRRRRRELARV